MTTSRSSLSAEEAERIAAVDRLSADGQVIELAGMLADPKKVEKEFAAYLPG